MFRPPSSYDPTYHPEGVQCHGPYMSLIRLEVPEGAHPLLLQSVALTDRQAPDLVAHLRTMISGSPGMPG